MSASEFQAIRDHDDTMRLIYSCPLCSKPNVINSLQHRHECVCGRFIIDLGQSAADFLNCIQAEPVAKPWEALAALPGSSLAPLH